MAADRDGGLAAVKIHFLPANIDGQGCYRCIFPAAYLSELGHVAGIPGFVLEDGNGNRVPPLPGVGLAAVPPGDFVLSYLQETVPVDADVYVIQLGFYGWQREWFTKLREENSAAVFVLELDDHLHDVPSYIPAKLDPSRPDANRRFAQQICEQVDAIVCATPALARFYGRWNANVSVVPNLLHWPMWAPVPPVYLREDWSRFRVGYMGNAAFHGPDLKLWGRVLESWLQRHPDAEFVAAGDPRLHSLVGTPRGQRVSTAKVWFRNLDLASITSTFDVGLVPLVRNEFNEAKSCLKGMEYAACGIPCIASPTEEYKRWVVDGETGFLASRPADAIAALDLLYENRGLLREMGEAAYERAREHSFDRRVGEWESFFESVCDGDHADRSRQGAAA